MKLPLFPLKICLLPQGYTQLRVFEPRYQRLVSESLKAQTGFGLCMLNDSQHILSIGTLVKIVDFETLEDGLLGITIKGISRLKIKEISVDEDGLKIGEVEQLNNWPSEPIREVDKPISEKLQTLLAQYPEHFHRYEINDFKDASWTCQRWLEILPLDNHQKAKCIQANNHQATLEILRTLI